MADLTQDGNRYLLDVLLALRDDVERAMATPPAYGAEFWYRYSTVDTVYSILVALDAHGVDALPLIRGRAVADLGCADGVLSFWAERAGADRVVAIDSSPVNRNAVSCVRTLRSRLGSGIAFVDADAHDWRPQQPFDTIFCLGLLYHTMAPQRILTHLSAACSTLVLGTKVWRDERPLMYVYEPGECNGDRTNWVCPTPLALRRMVERAGFAVDLVDVHGGAGSPTDMEQDARAVMLARALPPAVCGTCGASEVQAQQIRTDDGWQCAQCLFHAERTKAAEPG
jgi:2-polyprenyl-3-methyl-5-hydroxy-6-metoxy-1,4-benzoquinol methylase